MKTTTIWSRTFSVGYIVYFIPEITCCPVSLPRLIKNHRDGVNKCRRRLFLNFYVSNTYERRDRDAIPLHANFNRLTNAALVLFEPK